jgi:hypothetical protein
MPVINLARTLSSEDSRGRIKTDIDPEQEIEVPKFFVDISRPPSMFIGCDAVDALGARPVVPVNAYV